MPTFKLTEDTIVRLKEQFARFQGDREAVRDRLENYVADYGELRDRRSLDRQEELREKYPPLPSMLSHLTWNEKGDIFWGARDIAIVLGRSHTSITRTLNRMREEDGWRDRLLFLRHDGKAGNGRAMEVYSREIFDLILDHYEEEYLRRFAEPRRGVPDKAPDIQEVRRFWDYLKAEARVQRERAVFRDAEEWMERREEMELPDIPAMKWRDVIAFLWHKVFTVRTGMFLSILFALCFELVRRWPVLLPWIVGVSAAVFLACAALLHCRRGSPSAVASVGAGALLFALLWGAGLLSSDGVIHAPGGSPLELRGAELTMDVTAKFQKGTGRHGPEIWFRFIPSDYHNVKEVFYRLDSEGEYISTGFNSHNYPNLGFETSRTKGTITLEVKCLDAQGREHGPWTWVFDIDKELERSHSEDDEEDNKNGDPQAPAIL
ncbi:MAG: hypothetical protein IJU98_10445 [Synergistaceae bacterium]|nr:hypothetical protein [Synergistaceae bacterium]